MRKPMTYVCLAVAVILTVLIVPVSARALMCYETTLDLQASVGPDSIDRVLYRWSDDEMIPGVQLMDWSMEPAGCRLRDSYRLAPHCAH